MRHRMQAKAAAIALFGALALSGCATVATGGANGNARGNDAALSRALDLMMAGQSQMQGAELERAVAAAAQYPLGSIQNPVRAAMPPGQRAYLSRLRCPDGATPSFTRRGNLGPGPYNNIIDDYAVTCPGKNPVSIVMDMYHAGYVENRAVPGFTITGR